MSSVTIPSASGTVGLHTPAIADFTNSNSVLVASIHGGRLKRYSSQWSQIIQEPFILELEIVNGYKMDFYK